MTFEQWLEEAGALLSPGSLAIARRTWEAATMVATLAERERCANVCADLCAKHEDEISRARKTARGPRSYNEGAADVLTKAISAIREGVKS